MMSYIPAAVEGGLGAVTGYFGTPDYSKAYDQYATDILNNAQMFNPAIKYGRGMAAATTGLGAYRLANPNMAQDRIAMGYSTSPYEQQIMQNTTDMMNTNAANTGMQGSTAANAQLENQLAEQQHQWEDEYINRGLNNYYNAMAGLGRQSLNAQARGWQGLNNQYGAANRAAQAQLEGSTLPTRSQSALIGGMGAAQGVMPQHFYYGGGY